MLIKKENSANNFDHLTTKRSEEAYYSFLVSHINRGPISHQLTDDNVLAIQTCNMKGCVTI